MNFDVSLSRTTFLYFCTLGIKRITTSYASRFSGESYCKYQLCALDLGTHLQIAHTLYLFSYHVFIEGSSEKDYFLMINNRNHLYLALKCIICLFVL